MNLRTNNKPAVYRWYTEEELTPVGPVFDSVVTAKEWRYAVCSKRAVVKLFKQIGRQAWEEVV